MRAAKDPWTGKMAVGGKNTLYNILISSGVNIQGEPFCHISVNDGELVGQLDPDEVRQMALAWLETAGAAETDSLIFKLLTQSIELSPEAAGTFLVELRKSREQQ